MGKKVKKQLKPALPVYQIKIALDCVKPPVCRRVQLEDCSLDALHDIIQVSMGWDDEHLYAFAIEGRQYGDLDGGGGDFADDAQSIRLSDLVRRGVMGFRYVYNFDEPWRHTIDIERTVSAEAEAYYPRCVKGQRACPPENCGGPGEYPGFLAKIRDPGHNEYEDALAWVGGQFDPDEFSLQDTNQELRQLRDFLGHPSGEYSVEALDDPNDRIRMALGLSAGDDLLPTIDEQNQRKFLDYLRAKLVFPFVADCSVASLAGSHAREVVTVLGFADPPIEPREGVVCLVRKGRCRFRVLLSNIHVDNADPNFQPVEDYTYWLWEGDECDADDENQRVAFSRIAQ